MRAYDVRDVVDREWRALGPEDRRALSAFGNGVNAAMRSQPRPLEFRLLMYQPRPWDPRDSLAVALAISISVGDTPANVIARDALWRSTTHPQYARLFPLSDDRYDVAFGSNAWAAGAAHSVDGHALIANDPHLTPELPGIWYLVEMHSPALHVAGVTIPGIPGVVLGHNDRLAWAATNAMAATLSVFRGGARASRCRMELFHVRFARDRLRRYCGTRRDFELVPQLQQGPMLVRWAPYADSRSALTTVLALDRAPDLAHALKALRSYAGPPQNFLLAASDGRVAYHLAGPIANDPAWGRYVHPASDISKTYGDVPFDRLPNARPSRDLISISANNKMYRPAYPYRLSAMFAPPYRAYRIAQLLRTRSSYDAAYFERMQLDAVSPADAEFAHRLAAYARRHAGILSSTQQAALSRWNGSFFPRSMTATLEHRLRTAAEDSEPSPYSALDAVRSNDLPETTLDSLRTAAQFATPQPWSRAGSIPALHPFGPIGFPFLNGVPLPGDGDEFTIRVQTPDLSQSFRSVWEAGAWDAGGLSIPGGESGERASPHYDDLRNQWVRGVMQQLPFSRAAILRAARSRLVLEPSR